MNWVSIVSLVVAIAALLYSIISNTKKYELTYQYYSDILNWHNKVIEVLSDLKINSDNKTAKNANLSKLSALIETGRFYFPNILQDDGFGNEKPSAYRGRRNIVLDFLVYEYKIFKRDDCMEYIEYAENFQRLFTSYVFDYLDPIKHNKKIKIYTNISTDKELTINDYLKKSPDAILAMYSNIKIRD